MTIDLLALLTEQIGAPPNSAWVREQSRDKNLGHCDRTVHGVCAFVDSVVRPTALEGYPFDSDFARMARDMRAEPDWTDASPLVGERVRGSQHVPPRRGYNLKSDERAPGRWWTCCHGEVG